MIFYKQKRCLRHVPFLLCLVFLFSACSQRSPLIDVSNGQSISVQSNPEDASVTLQKGFVLSLTAGDCEVLYNGISTELKNAPFIQNGIFYMPLRDVTELLGGTYSFSHAKVTIKLFGNVSEYEIGSAVAVINNEKHTFTGLRYYFNEEDPFKYVSIDNDYVLIEIDGVVYIPADSNYIGFDSGFGEVSPLPESHMVILGGFTNELGTREIHLNDVFDGLSDEFKAQFILTKVDEVLHYNIEQYITEDLAIYVMRLQAGFDDVENMNGKVCAINVLSDRYSTPRGLTVGDSLYRAWRLYGDKDFSSHLAYLCDGGYVKNIIFYSRYYGGQWLDVMS